MNDKKRKGNKKMFTEELLDILEREIAGIIHATKENKDYNARNLVNDALRLARYYLKKYDYNQIVFLPGEPNTKTHLKSIDLLPFVTCHTRCLETCGKIRKGKKYNKGLCYVLKMLYRNARTCARLAINTALAIDRPDKFWEGVNLLLMVSRYVRCFVSGDANLPGFFGRLCDTIEANPHCNVQGFSKCYEAVNAYIAKHGRLPKNFKLLLSGWDGMKPDNPYNLPVSDVYDETLPEGWLSCGGNCLNCACIGLGCWKASNGDTVGLKKH